ncbi:Potassium uptake protein TrkH [Lachnospiraceae bacterium TWA4]|nr:Potassium uptake protein TrkH [Lachnospiraceae bacterium TWA4]
MNYRMMGRFIAQILTIESVFLIPALLISLFYLDYQALKGFFITLLIGISLAGILFYFCRESTRGFYAKDGLVCVAVGWIVMSLLGALPFYISREIPNYLNALFEIVSGFTTTGASILPEVESLSKGILYWRSFSHWIGGMGVLVFLLAIAPVHGKNKGFTMHLLRAESPGPNVDKLVPKMKKTAMILYLLYIALTIINMIFLLIGHMPLFDALCTAFGTAGTGGFGIKNDSMASYSPYIQNVCTVFMLLFGVNFSCYYLLLMKQFKNVLKDEELRLYVGIIIASIVLITWNISGMYDTIGESLRHAAFQVATIITTTGFATTDFNLWPSFSKTIMLTLMCVGACAGSTGGGIKCGRILLLFKSLHRNIRRVINPKKIQVIRINNHKIDEKIIDNTNAYLAAYIIIIFLSFMIISLDNFSITTNFSAVLACFNNIGPGFDAVGPTCNFSAFSPLSKLVLIGDMLAGRLEIFPILILLSRSTWRHR